MRTETRHFIMLPGTDIEVETPYALYDESDTKFSPREGGGFHVAILVPDEHSCATDLVEWDDPDTDPAQWSNGVLIDFDPNYAGPNGPEAFRDFIETMSDKVGPENVFILDRYSHGMDNYSRVNSRFLPDRQWDVSQTAVLVVPPDVTNPTEWADGMLESWNAAITGDAWGIVGYSVDADGEIVDGEGDSCWGFLGHDYAASEMTAYTDVVPDTVPA